MGINSKAFLAFKPEEFQYLKKEKYWFSHLTYIYLWRYHRFNVIELS